MASVVKQLTDNLEKLRAQRAALDERIHAYELTLADFVRDGEQEERPRQTGGILTNEIWKVLRDVGSPMHYKDVCARVQERGFPVPGTNPANNVGAHMSADPRFENVGRGTWALRSWRTQEADSQPAPVTDEEHDPSAEIEEEPERGKHRSASEWHMQHAPAGGAGTTRADDP